MANRHMKDVPHSLPIREKQIKTIMRNHCPPTRMAIIKIMTITSVDKDVKK